MNVKRKNRNEWARQQNVVVAYCKLLLIFCKIQHSNATTIWDTIADDSGGISVTSAAITDITLPITFNTSSATSVALLSLTTTPVAATIIVPATIAKVGGESVTTTTTSLPTNLSTTSARNLFRSTTIPPTITSRYLQRYQQQQEVEIRETDKDEPQPHPHPQKEYHETQKRQPFNYFRFEKKFFNVTIPENGIGKTYAVSQLPYERIGLEIHPECTVQYRIVGGDRERLFKVDERIVGNFAFLVLHTREHTNNVLNREKTEEYLLKIKANIRCNRYLNNYKANINRNINSSYNNNNQNNSNSRKYKDDGVNSHDRNDKNVADEGRNAFWDSKGHNGKRMQIRDKRRTHTKAMEKYKNIRNITVNVNTNDQYLDGDNNNNDRMNVISNDQIDQIDNNNNDHVLNIIEQHEADCLIHVQVIDRNDLSPLFYPVEYNVSIPEDLPLHHSIVQVQAEDADLGINGEIYYSLYNGTDYFAIHPTTGVITSVRSLFDCTVNTFELIAFANDRGSMIAWTASLSTLTMLTTTSTMSSTWSIDTDSNGYHHSRNYHSHNRHHYHHLYHPQHGTPYTSRARVFINIEKVNLHSPEIHVNTVSSAFKHVNVDANINNNENTHTDADDNFHLDSNSNLNINMNLVAPEIQNSNSEDYLTSRIYGIVKVTDLDSGRNGQISELKIIDGDPDGKFQIIPTTDQQISVNHRFNDNNDNINDGSNSNIYGNGVGEYYIQLNKFVILNTLITTMSAAPENLTSSTSTKKALKHIHQIKHLNNIFNLTLYARDNGKLQRSTTKLVPITIYNMDIFNYQNVPIFTKQLYEVSILESSPIGMPVIRLKVTNSFEYEKISIIQLEIVGGNEGGEFIINPDTGMLYTQKRLDAEYKSFYTLMVNARDLTNIGNYNQNNYNYNSNNDYNTNVNKNNNKHKQSSVKVKINIIDINDNDPIFHNNNLSTILLSENELAGTFVTKITAKDQDSGENAYISYSLVNSMDDHDDANNIDDLPFDIDHFSGVIRTTILIDYETMRRNYKLHIRASDWGLPYSRQSEMILNIQIIDVNDNRPQFERTNCKGSILRIAPIGTEIFTLSAIDFDVGDYITYRLVYGNDDGCFNLDPSTGVFSIACNLTKSQSSYLEKRIINVTANDGTHLSDEMSIQIELINKDQYESTQYLSHLSGYSNFECQDTGVARKLADILSTSEKNNFNVNYDSPSTNDFIIDELYTTSGLHRYRDNIYRPEFINWVIEINVNESISLGETILWIKAKDNDIGYNGKLNYAITTGDVDSVFRMDSETGELQLIGYLDRERQDHYALNITICDLGQPAKCNSRILSICILDNNDNPPIFQKSLIRLHLFENITNGSLVFCLNTTDADIDENAIVTYSFKTEDRKFTINSENGCIMINDNLDRETQNVHTLEIIARDKGQPPLFSEALVTVILDDINDNSPTFGLQEMIFKIREDLPIDSVVAIIEAHDLDVDDNGVVHFLLRPDGINNNLPFHIDFYNGVIRTSDYLDYESYQFYNLIVTACDAGHPSLSTTLPVIIEIIDVNENRFAPEFGDFVFIGSIHENQPRGTFVMNITARDLDAPGPDSEISYSIHGGDGIGIFSVNEKGTISTMSHLDAETKNFYWLTLCGQDHGIVPLISCTQVYINVYNVNDNVPMTAKPVYYPKIAEGSPAGTRIIKLDATDEDNDDDVLISFKITSGNPEGFFEITPAGELLSTQRKLDRENQAEHILEISIIDNGKPQLSSTTRVVINVEDINDHSPRFDQRFYKVQVPSTFILNASIAQVQAVDNDIGENGRIIYSIKSGKGKNKFYINPDNGHIFAIKSIEIDGEYELIIRAEDCGTPKRSQTTRLHMSILPVLEISKNPPIIKTIHNVVEVTENDHPGFLVALIQATDKDGDYIWYNISDGNTGNEFYIGRENGNILLSKSLDCEKQKRYNLTISVTDGSHTVFMELYVNVLNTNDNRPQFNKDVYIVNISEGIEEEAIIMQLHANDADEDTKIFYTLHGTQDPTSLHYFRIDSITGKVIVTQRIDYERNKKHVLTVIAKDQGTPTKRNYAKVIILIHDENDHHPEFMSKIVQSKIPEGSAIGSIIAHLNAVDRDNGLNGEVEYSIVAGNAGNIFEIDKKSGVIRLLQNLNIMQMQEYMLQVKASDCGQPPLASHIPVHIIITMSENDPPRFSTLFSTVEIYENLPIGSFIANVEARSSSSVFYEIVDGNDLDYFYINPTTGVVFTNAKIDYEKCRFFNLTICGTNMASIKSVHNIIVHILDVNDNVPYFQQTQYYGRISESAKVGTYIYKTDSTSLIYLMASDLDMGKNSLLEYTIIDNEANLVFHIDASTGTIKLLQQLDYETKQFFKFNVMVNDMGDPKLYSSTMATIYIAVLNVNDCPPIFDEKNLNITLFLPTYEGVQVASITATDQDNDDSINIRYDIVDGNFNECFSINNLTGVITVRNVQKLNSLSTLHIRASDGLHSTITQIDIVLENVHNSRITFRKARYEFYTIENSTKIAVVGLVNVIGNMLYENIMYRILNPTILFEIGKTSGAIKTTGIMFDRETLDSYELIIEATSTISYKSIQNNISRAITHVTVHILDENDNCPMFVNLPYYATLSQEEEQGAIVITVKAIDSDSAENGEVAYEMKRGNSELFKIDRKTGNVILNQILKDPDKSYELTISAYDGAMPRCVTDTSVLIKVVDKSMPIFGNQFYSDNIKEDVEIFSALSVAVQADSPLQRKLIYTISDGNDEEFFEIDYRTGVLYVVNHLDYETKEHHRLLVRATDSVTGVYAETSVSINVHDANDCYPELKKYNYNIIIEENSFLGTEILTLNATDCDSGANSALSYFIETVNGKQDSSIFHIDIQTGLLYLKDTIDYETCRQYYIIVVIKDHGTPSLSTKVNIWVTVLDLNDNAPEFIEPSFSNRLSINAPRGQLVTITKAFDADDCDNSNLKYKIVEGNEHQMFLINENNGLLILQNNQKLHEHKQSILNVSVSDGIHTTYARVKITLLPENIHSPYFERTLYEATILENQNFDTFIIQVKANDKDFGIYGTVFYEIVGDDMNTIFRIDKINGAVYAKQSLDREIQSFYDLLLRTTDGGGKFSYTILKIKVEDVNDNSPQFPVNEYKVTIRDDIKFNDTIIKLVAIDKDLGENSVISYAIRDNTLNQHYMDYLEMRINGELLVKRSLVNISFDTVQFFVRATDHGRPELYNDIPITLTIISSNVSIPTFDKSEIHINVEESVIPGSTLAKLKVNGNFSVRFTLATQTNRFSISKNGDIILMQILDREEKNLEHIVAMAETETKPALSAYTNVYFYVQDNNDLYPKFSSVVYNINVPENVQKSTSLLKITATDMDEGSNGDIRYAIENDNFSNLFDIDIYSGWISLLAPLDREVQSEYYFNIVATDNGQPKHSSKVPIAINVLDYNDNPPQIKLLRKQIDVWENTQPGTVITSLRITDADLEKNTLDYFIMKGDTNTQFQIDNNGDLIISKALDRETLSIYNLTIATTDGKFITFINMTINIKDINDNFPVCNVPRYKINLNESTPVQSKLVKITAIDADEESNKNLRYSLSGNNTDTFSIDSETGIIKLKSSLDRELHPYYILYAHVYDGVDKENSMHECISEVMVSINDTNDNRPEFLTSNYIASIPEDAQLNTIITKIHATDKDFGRNRKITYAFSELNEFFSISLASGIVKLIKTLDRENISIFIITVVATDHGQPQMIATTNLTIHVLDINDNPPEFQMKIYSGNISEDAIIGTQVLQVFATSRDIGVNAEISYYIVGGNEQKRFQINKQTGVIVTTMPIDYEKTKAFFLTVQATDGGSPSLSSQTFVNISVLDVNDNRPLFIQTMYRVHLLENSRRGEKVVQVMATDEDSDQNGSISYNIERGDRFIQFMIDKFNGQIYVNDHLDRETIDEYTLDIRACDNGTPDLCSFVEVNINILDVNDNPPTFQKANYSIVLQENKPLGYLIINLEIHDADEPPNSNPYTFDFKSGNEGGFFRLEQDGNLRTAAKFNHRICDYYILQIRVFDNGTPPLYSDTWVSIKIIEESQYPPIITPLEITVNSYEDDFAGGFLGKIYVTDQDHYDTFVYELMPTMVGGHKSSYSTLKLFNISRTSGELFAINNLDIGVYHINITVSDGKFISHAISRVCVEMIDTEIVDNSVIMHLNAITPTEFILSHRKGFIKAIRDVMHCRQKDVIIISLSNSSIERHQLHNHYRHLHDTYQFNQFPQQFNQSLKHFINNTTNLNTITNTAIISKNKYGNNIQLHSNHKLVSNFRIINDQEELSNSINHTLEIVFAVRKQQIVPNSVAYFASEDLRTMILRKMEEIEYSTNLEIQQILSIECKRNNCLNGVCLNQIVLSRSQILTYPTDVISFVLPAYKVISVCHCKQGYDGKHCNETINACSSDPCPTQKLCLPANVSAGFQCVCPIGYTGLYCEIKSPTIQCHEPTCSNVFTSISFGGKSYAHYIINKSVALQAIGNQFIFTLRVRTVQQSGTLLYASGNIDYHVIELLNGATQYRFDLGSGEGLISVSSVYISDGEWHFIAVERIFNSAKLIVDNKHTSHASAPGVNVILNLQSNDIFLGAEVKPHHTIIGYDDIQRGFVGCLADIRIGNEPLPLYISGGITLAKLKRFTNIEFSCDPARVLVNPGICGTQPCFNTGLCKDMSNNHFKCLCPERFTGKLCEIDMDPCASTPCLYGGRCENVGTNNYTCICPLHLSGKRCEYGQYCTPNPCKNAGICEEGDGMPHCICRGYTGPTCEIDVNECDKQPCGSGATCINEAGSFRCICPSYLTGASCGDPLYSNSISTQFRNFSVEHLTGIISGIAFVFIFCLFTVCCIMFRKGTTVSETSSSSSASSSRATRSIRTSANTNHNRQLERRSIRSIKLVGKNTPSATNMDLGSKSRSVSTHNKSTVANRNTNLSVTSGNSNISIDIHKNISETTLNSLLENEKLLSNRTNLKVSNLEINQRPISYTPSTAENSIYTSNTHSNSNSFVNNLDVLRTYDSTGVDFNNVPIEYQKIGLNNENINLNNDSLTFDNTLNHHLSLHHHHVHSNSNSSSCKRGWCHHMQLKTFYENKLHNEKVDLNVPLNRMTNLKPSCSKLIQVTMPNISASEFGLQYGSVSSANSNCEYSAHGQYHWDCSDWARISQNLLPDITEVPSAEILDSSSFHSNDSNESKSLTYIFQNNAISKFSTAMKDISRLDEKQMSSDDVDTDLQHCQRSFQKPLLNSSLSRLKPSYYNENADYKTNSVQPTVPLTNVTKHKIYLPHPHTSLPPLHNLNEIECEEGTVADINDVNIPPRTEGLTTAFAEKSHENGITPYTSNNLNHQQLQQRLQYHVLQEQCSHENSSGGNNLSMRLCEIDEDRDDGDDEDDEDAAATTTTEMESFLPHKFRNDNN